MERFRPYVILSAAISLDGKLASIHGDSQLSSKVDIRRIHKLRTKVDAVLVGRRTVSIDNPLLTVRYTKGRNPIRIILDSNGTIKFDSKILKTCNIVPTLIAVSEEISKANFTRLKKYPIQVIKCGKKRINLKQLFRILYKKGIKKILVEGGGLVNWSLINERMIDEIIVTVTPFVLGGADAVSLVGGKGFEKISNSCSLRLKKASKKNNEIVLDYIVRK